MADGKTVITIGILVALALGQSSTGNNSKLGQAGTKLTGGAASIAEKASGFVSNPQSSGAEIPSQVSSAPVIINPSGPGESVSAAAPATVAISSSDGGMDDLNKNMCGPRSAPHLCAGSKPNAAQIAAGIR